MTDWIAVVLSLIAIVISVIAYTSGLPRLKIRASGPAIMVGGPEVQGSPPVGIIVTINNDGGAPAHLNQMYLMADGVAGRRVAGPSFPVKIEALGDTKRWQEDPY